MDIKHPRYHNRISLNSGWRSLSVCSISWTYRPASYISERTTFYSLLVFFFYFLLKNDLTGNINRPLQDYLKNTLYLSSYFLAAMFYYKQYKQSWGENTERGAWTQERLMQSAVRISYGRLWSLLHIHALSLRKMAFPSSCVLTSKPVYNSVFILKKKNT